MNAKLGTLGVTRAWLDDTIERRSGVNVYGTGVPFVTERQQKRFRGLGFTAS